MEDDEVMNYILTAPQFSVRLTPVRFETLVKIPEYENSFVRKYYNVRHSVSISRGIIYRTTP